MGWIRNAAAAAVIGAMCGWGTASGASTLTYYYVGQPYLVTSGPLGWFNTGTVTVDASQPLARRTIAGRADEPGSGLLSIEFGAYNYGSLTFDAEGRISDWFLEGPQMPVYWATSRSEFFDLAVVTDPWYLTPREWAGELLGDLGYTPGTPAFEKAYAYFDDPSDWFTLTRAAGPGEWFDSFYAAAQRIQENTLLAAANPPLDWRRDIAPIPLPAPLALLVGGLGALVLVARRQARRPKRS